MITPRRLIPLGLAVLGLTLLARAEAHASPAPEFSSWPANADPRLVGARVAQRFLASPHPNFGVFTSPPAYITYPESCTWYGALAFAGASDNPALSRALADRFIPLFGADARLIPEPVEVDRSIFGLVPLQLFLVTRDHRYLALGLHSADQQWDNASHPAVANGPLTDTVEQGLSWQTRFWIDDMYMITVLQTEAYRATGEPKYLDRAARETVAYLDRLQQPNGLFYHSPDTRFFWGRGNGWIAAGLTELLTSLPPGHPLRPRILDGYRRLMETLRADQDATGMWHQIVDDPSAWPETSCTGMFTFAFIRGVQAGWLDQDYAPPARRAWLALVGYLNADGNLRQICEGTPKKNDRAYYLARRRLTGAMYGQAPMLWCATALLAPEAAPSLVRDR